MRRFPTSIVDQPLRGQNEHVLYRIPTSTSPHFEHRARCVRTMRMVREVRSRCCSSRLPKVPSCGPTAPAPSPRPAASAPWAAPRFRHPSHPASFGILHAIPPLTIRGKRRPEAARTRTTNTHGSSNRSSTMHREASYGARLKHWHSQAADCEYLSTPSIPLTHFKSTQQTRYFGDRLTDRPIDRPTD